MDRMMLTTKSKTLFLFGGILILAYSVFITIHPRYNLASVIGGSTNTLKQCISQISPESTLTDYNMVRVDINTDTRKDYVLEGNTDDLCGSAGCIHRLCVIEDHGVTLLPFAYASERIEIQDTVSDGMHDIHLSGKSNVTLQWEGRHYIVLQ